MELLIKISGNGDMMLENSDGIVQYVAKYKSDLFEGTIFDDLALTELISVKNTEEGFLITAFDSPVGTFSKDGARFCYQSAEHRIEQEGASFIIYYKDSECARIERAENGFRLTITGALTPLMGFALVILIIAAKQKANALKMSKKRVEEAPAPEVTEKKEEARTEETAEEKPKINFKFRIDIKSYLKKLKNGSKAALIVMLASIVGFIATLSITAYQDSEISKLKTKEVYFVGKKESVVTFHNKTYSFKTPEEHIDGAPLYVYYTEKTKTTKSGEKEVTVDKFYSTYPDYFDFSIVTVLLIASAVISAFIYILTAFELLGEENLAAIKIALSSLKNNKNIEDAELYDGTNAPFEGESETEE